MGEEKAHASEEAGVPQARTLELECCLSSLLQIRSEISISYCNVYDLFSNGLGTLLFCFITLS